MSADARKNITEALLWRVSQLAPTLNPPVKVSEPNVRFTPEQEAVGTGTTIKPYIAVAVLPNESRLSGIAYTSERDVIGLLTINVVWPSGQGVLKPLGLAGQITEVFKPGLVIERNGIKVRVDEEPHVAPDIQESDRVTVPVIIRWRASAPAHG